MRIYFFIPLLVFAVLVGFFGWRLALMERGHRPDAIASALIGKPAPEFDLPPLLNNAPGFKTSDLKGKVTLVNFFASWCPPCRAEHPLLTALAGQGAVLAGIAYKTREDEGRKWIEDNGNPYDLLGTDLKGATSIDFGLYGVPETYVIDKQGIIRYRLAEPLTKKAIDEEILPLIAELNK